MPIYEYRCENDHTFEVLQKFTDDPVSTCEVCGAPARRVLHPVAIHFKGSGFYSTDYGRRKGKPDGAKDGAKESSSFTDSSSSSTDSSKGSSSSTDSSSGGAKKAAEA